MVRETRHLWIGNLPESVREEEIRDLFQRHGRVQSVKLLSEENPGGGTGRPIKSATVAFIDIRSASKALRNVRSIAGQPIHINYHEPGSAPTRAPPPSLELHSSSEPSINNISDPLGITQGNSNPNVTGTSSTVNNNCIPGSPAGGMYRQQRFAGQHGQLEDASSHFYEQKSFSRGRGDGHGFHGGRGRRDTRPPFHNNNRHSFPADNRNYRSQQWGYSNEGRYAPPVHSVEVDDRPPVPASVSHPPLSESSSKGSRRPESPASSASSRHITTKRHRSRSVSESGSSDRGSSVGSRSRSGSHSSVSTSVSSGHSRSPSHHGHFSRGGGSSSGGRFHHNHNYSRQGYNRSRMVSRSSDSRIRHSSRSPMAASPSSSTSSSPSPHRKIAAPHSPSHSPSSSKSYSPSRNVGGSHHHNNNHHHHHRRAPNSAEMHAAIKIRNLPIRSSDTSLKDGLYHEYKKHGKVAWVRVIGAGSDRYAIVCFKSTEHAARAVSLSQDKQFFGCKIQVTPFHHGKNDEIIGTPETETRLMVEEEPTSVGYPTRTVLITGLDAAVTQFELKSAFDQYGDIVHIDIRKQGTATHAVCEFVDIASAIRAQWGRHVFKSKEARISFYRNPPSNSLLLDGTTGVNDKQVYGHCCQYGAIKRIVMDPERVLALVQFEEISSAQTAIRQLRSWVIKGKHLQVDFASNEVIRRFLERLSTGLVSPVESSSPGLVSSPSIGNSIAPFQDGGNSGRRIRLRIDEDDSIYRSGDIDSFKSGRMIKTLEKSISSEKLHIKGSVNVLHSGSEMLTTSDSDAMYRIQAVYTSPVSPDADQSVTDRHGHNDDKSIKCNSSRSKIDLSCHETDSAIVTSSSDVIGEKCETHTNHGSSSSSLNGDEKLSSLESDGARRPSLTTDISSHTPFVDGVSSTSPEPKTETVRKASPDPGIGASDSVPRFSGDTRIFSGCLSDPRKKPSDCKVRRSSADSGNNSIIASSHMHSTTGTLPSYSALTQPQSSTTTTTTVNNVSVASVDGNESDDRPGTPLCDENPEGFETSDPIPAVPFKHSRTQSFTSIGLRGDPISLPLPEFALNRQRTNSNTSSKEYPSSSIRLSRSSSETNLKSPIKSPSASCNNISVMTSSSTFESDYSLLSVEGPMSPFSSSTNGVWNDESVSKNISTTRVCSVVRRDSISSVKLTDPRTCKSEVEIISGGKIVHNNNNSNKNLEEHHDSCGVIIAGSPDSEIGLSPKASPASVSLEQRIQKCCEKYDRWTGSRENVNSALPVTTTNSGIASSMVVDSCGQHTTTIVSNSNHHPVEQRNSESNNSSSCSSRFPLTKHKFLDLDELRHQPSDIGRSVLARRSVFDEDTKRLENFGEKYEAKGSSVPAGSNNWRVLALQRSASTSGTGTNNSSSWPTPASPSTPLTPPLSSTGILSPGFSIPNNPSLVRLSISSVTSYSPAKVASSPLGGSSALHNINSSNSSCSLQKSKDLNNAQCVTSNKPTTKLETICRSNSQPSPQLASLVGPSIKPPQQQQQQQTVLTKPTLLEAPKSPATAILKISETRDQLKPIQTTNAAKPPASVALANPQQLHHHQVPSSSSCSGLSSSHGPNIGMSPMVHQGLPRAVERSLSLDSKKTSLSTSPWVAPGGLSSQNPNPGNNSIISTPSTVQGNNNGVSNFSRRSSVDSHSPLPNGNNNNKNKSENVSQSVLDKSENSSYSSNSTSASSKQVKDPTTTICAKGGIINNNNTNETPVPSNSGNYLISSSEKNSKTSNVVVVTESHLNNNNNKDVQISKSEFDLIKREIMEIRPIQQETTVAVVATEQIPFIPSRNESVVGASSTKESAKKEKEKKRRSSGTTSTASSITPPSTYINTAKVDSTTTTTQQSSSRESISSSGKRLEDKKEKKETKPSPESNSKSDEAQKAEGSSSTSTHHKREDRKEKKEKKEKVDKESTAVEHTSSSWKDHSHRGEREDLAKRKRRLSSHENEHEQKKPKVEKEGHEASLHQRLKGDSSNVRRESRDSSCSSKDKTKESSRTSSVSQPPETSSHRDKSKDENKKESHHKSSKDKTPSGSVKDKHQYHGEKSRTPSESRSNHQTSKLEGHSGKDRQKKDKASPGKENVKGSSKHHNVGGSSHHSSGGSSRNKESSSSVKGSSKSKERSSSKSQSERQHHSVDSESEVVLGKSQSSVNLDGTTRSDSFSGHERGKSDKYEKRDSSGRRDRHRSGGENPSTSGGSERSKNREQRKKKKNVIEDSDSSDSDDEEKKKHHSIFEVVIDEYVSMYDKVKARSNRACKSTPHQPQQVEEVKKQDKIKDQFRELKKSRAKKIEKKRSTSVDESNKSIIHTSSDDEGSQHEMSLHSNADEKENHRKSSKDEGRSRQSVLTQSSDDDEEENEEHSSSKSRSLRKMKSKSKSSSSNGDKQSKKRGRKNNKTSPSLFQGSAASVFSNSDYESNASSTHLHEPEKKKKRLISKSNSMSEPMAMSSMEHKSSEDTLSDSDDTETKKPVFKSQNREARESVVSSKIQEKKLQTTDIYSDSDDSSVESGPVRSSSHKPIVAASTSGKDKKKERLSKQKRMRKSLFEYSDSSEEEKKIVVSSHETNKKERTKESSSSSKSKEKESKSSRKKHRVHSTSASLASLKSSGKSSKKQRVSSGDGVFDVNTHESKREQMEDILFGPMTSSSSSETEDKKEVLLPSRPKTPTMEQPTKFVDEGAFSTSRKKSSSIVQDSRKPSRSLSPCSSIDFTPSDHQETNKPSVVTIPSVTTSKPSTSEKKRKKHHKEKRTRKGDGDDHFSRSSKSGISEGKSAVDYDLLFNSPRHSPSKDISSYKPMSPILFIKEEPISMADTTTPTTTINISKVSVIEAEKITEQQKPPVEKRIEIIPPEPMKMVVQQSGMFSSDEDDDDDNKLKIDINEAIIASSDEPPIDSVLSVIDESIVQEKKKREEEEKKLHCLFEQDKAIESIVLLERKSSPPPPCPVGNEDETIKDETVKDCTAISQEETEDAVAALLETLEGEDEVDEPPPPPVKAPISATIPPSSIHSPPTIRIIEEPTTVVIPQPPPPSEPPSSASIISSNIQACIDRVAKPSKEQQAAWDYESEVKAKAIEESLAKLASNNKAAEDSIKLDDGPPKTPDIVNSRKASVDSSVGSIIEERLLEESKKPARRASGSVKSRQGSSELEHDTGNTSADVYEFHDSDEEKNSKKGTHLLHSRHTPPVPTSTAKSPLTSPTHPVVTTPENELKSPSVPTIIPVSSSVMSQPPLNPPLVTPLISPTPPFPILPQVSKAAETPISVAESLPTLPKTPVVISPVIVVPPGIVGTSHKTPPSSITSIRNKIDETIEHVVRMAHMMEEESMPEATVPALTITSVKGGGPRGRSRSKDSVTDDGVVGTVSITKVISRPEGSPRSSMLPTCHPPNIQIDVPGTGRLEIESVPPPQPGRKDGESGGGGGEGSTGCETLIDPQTGILMPMMRQSEEGQYVPIVGKDQPAMLPKLQQPQFSVPAFQTKHDDLVAASGSKLEQENGNRPLSVVDRQQSFTHHQQQQAKTPPSNQKSEGLAAMFSHQQVFQQTQQIHPNQYGPPPANSVAVSKSLPQTRVVSLSSSTLQGQNISTIQNTMPKVPGALYTSPGMFHTHKGPVVSLGVGQQPTIGSPVSHSGNQTSSLQHETLTVSNPGSLPLVRTMFSNPSPVSAQQQQQQNHYQYAVISRGNEGSVRPILRHMAPSSHLSNHPNFGKLVSQASGSNQTQQQSELVNFQIPSATTITKVNTGQDERKQHAQSHSPAVVLSSGGGAAPPHNAIGGPAIPAGGRPQTLASPNANIAMTHQQHQQHQAQTELFRRSAEGLIRVVGNKEEHIHLRGNQEIGHAQPPRVDITNSIAQAAAASPNAGRIPKQHEQFPPSSTQSRVSQHQLAYESGEVRLVTPQGSLVPDSIHYSQSQQQQHMQGVYSQHYITGSVPGSNTVNNLPPTSTYSLRSGHPDKSQQQQQQQTQAQLAKTMPPVEIKGSTLIGMERGRTPQNLQQQQQHQMPHLPPPHAIDQRNSDSPMVASMYGNQRHIYQVPSPAHQAMPRETFKIMYTEAVDRQQHSQSPSYGPPYDNRAIVPPSSERVSSPYAVRDIGVPRTMSYSPPPAHGRYPGQMPNTIDTPSSNDRQRQMQVQTPPHAGQVPPQGDSLLMLLQRYPIMWQGLLALKNDNAACQMHFVSGNLGVARDSLPSNPDGSIPPLRISQRMRLEQTQLEGVARKMQMEAEHCILLALPCGRDHMDVLQQSNNLRTGFITYLQLKQAAGIVNICHPVTQQPAYVIHIFPSCDFANENLARIAPDLLHGVADIAHLLIVIATV